MDLSSAQECMVQFTPKRSIWIEWVCSQNRLLETGFNHRVANECFLSWRGAPQMNHEAFGSHRFGFLLSMREAPGAFYTETDLKTR